MRVFLFGKLSAHAPCAPDHPPYQGLQFSKAEYEDLQASLARPIGEWNCRHVAYPIVLGVSGAANSKEELEEMERYSNEKIEIDGHEYTRYECTQLQRKLEMEMRKANLSQKAVRVLRFLGLRCIMIKETGVSKYLAD